jgi:hypothetical protein
VSAESWRTTYDRYADQAWVPAYKSEILSTEEIVDTLAWLRSRPARIQRLAIRFPPRSLVFSSEGLYVPADGCVGIVHGYTESLVDSNDLVYVRQHADGGIVAQCRQSQLGVAFCLPGLTPAEIRRALNPPS